MKYFYNIPERIENNLSDDEMWTIELKKHNRTKHIFEEKKKLYPSEGRVKLHLTRYYIGTDDDL